MSKINQIEKELLAIDQANFQKLCDQVLFKKGYTQINSIGSVIGKNKTSTGTPDTLVSLENGNFVFVECTTQHDRIYSKFEDDLKKCFDESKTGISTNRIETIILCYNSTLDPKEIIKLTDLCGNHKISLCHFGINTLASELYHNYPGLARDFLGVPVDTDQIMSLDDFVDIYDKNKFTAPLNIGFHFREVELQNTLTKLETNSIVILSGDAGVGKSRLAREICTQYNKSHPTCKVFCVHNKQQDLADDIKVYFNSVGEYLIWIDDANRLSQLEHFFYLIHNQNSQKKYKILITVRHYALEKILESCREFIVPEHIAISNFSNDEIKQIIKTQFDIQNNLYLDQIEKIAHGNARLAIMAAKIAKETQTLDSILNVSSLYNQYYKSVKTDLGEFENKRMLQVSGILALYKRVAKTSDGLGSELNEINDIFGITPEIFWAEVNLLHKLELVDLYENDIARISDQVLATYFFYSAFFAEKVLNFSNAFLYYFPKNKHLLIDALKPTIDAFQSNEFTQTLKENLKPIWQRLSNEEDNRVFLDLINNFWWLDPTDALVYLLEKISNLPDSQYSDQELEIAILDEKNIEVYSPSILSCLKEFGAASKIACEDAIELILNYASKKPREIKIVIKVITDGYGVIPHSIRWDFKRELFLVEQIWKHTMKEPILLNQLIFYEVAEYFLQTYFAPITSSTNQGITITQINLPETLGVIQLRQSIWDKLFLLFKTPKFSEKIISKIVTYSLHGNYKKIIMSDSEKILPFIEQFLDPNNFLHCRAAQNYLNYLGSANISFDKNLLTRFSNNVYAVFELLIDDSYLRDFNSFEERKIKHKERLHNYFSTQGDIDPKELIAICLLISEKLTTHEIYQFKDNLCEILIYISEKHPDIYTQFFYENFMGGNKLNIEPTPLLLQHLFTVLGVDKTYQLITSFSPYNLKTDWIFGFFDNLPETSYNEQQLDIFMELYEDKQGKGTPKKFPNLTKWLKIDPFVFQNLLELLVAKSDISKEYQLVIYDMIRFSGRNHFPVLDIINASNVSNIEKAYFIAHKIDPTVDYDGALFNKILDFDSQFLNIYLNWRFELTESKFITRHDEQRNYDFLWLRSDYVELITGAFQIIYTKTPYFGLSNLAQMLLSTSESQSDVTKVLINDRKNQLVRDILINSQTDMQFFAFLFNTIVDVYPDDTRRELIQLFLTKNQDIAAFKMIRLLPSSMSWSGSPVPVFQERIDFLKSLLPMLNSIQFLKHRQFIENYVNEIQNDIKREKRREFLQYR